MPGTIQVSVLDLLDLPSSSSTSIYVKVSMGKREYHTLDKGDFLFPLMTLRDNLIITLHDGEGKELSRTEGVETMSVVQKGILDDIFVLQGGGRLHMKLQFTLNDNERKRIQDLRETALKKKQEELLTSSSLRHLETAVVAFVGGKVGSSSTSLNHEVTDSAKSLVQMEDVSNTKGLIQSGSLSNPESRRNDPIYGSGNEDGILLDPLEKSVPGSISNPDSISNSGDGDGILLNRLEQPEPSGMDGGGGASSTVLLSEELRIQNIEADEKILDKFESQLPPIDTPTRPILSLESLDPHSGDTSVSCTLEEDRNLNEMETQKTPTDIPVGLISSMKALDTHPGDHSVSNTLEDNRILDKTETQLPPTDNSVRPISLLEALDTHSGGHSVSGISETVKALDKIETQLPTAGIPITPISLKKTFDPYSGHHSVSSTFEDDRIRNLEKRSELKKTPSNVRKMISAFESSQAKGLATRVDAPTVKFQLNKSKSTGSFQGSNVKDLMIEKNKTNQATKTESSLFSSGKSQELNVEQSLKYIREQKDTGLEQPTKDNTHEHETSQEKLWEAATVKNKTQEVAKTESILSAKETYREMELQPRVNYIRVHKDAGMEQQIKEDVHEHETSEEELTGVSAAEPATFPRQIPASFVDTNQSCSVCKDQQDSTLKVLGKDEMRTCLQDTKKLISIAESPSEKTQLVVECGVEQYPFDSLGSCMFPDESRRLCITTGSKQVMDLVGGSGTFAETDRRKMILSITEATEEQNMDGDACSKVNQNEKNSRNLRRRELEGSADFRFPQHFIGQAGRVAIMVAFGTLVILTGQSKSR